MLKRNYNKFNPRKFCTDLNVSLEECYSKVAFINTESYNTCFNMIVKAIQSLMDKHKKFSRKKKSYLLHLGSPKVHQFLSKTSKNYLSGLQTPTRELFDTSPQKNAALNL